MCLPFLGNEFYPRYIIDNQFSFDDHYHIMSRGTLQLKSLKSSPAPYSFQQLSLPSSNLTSLRLSAKYGGYYFIRARSKFTDLLSDTSDSSKTSQRDYVITFISAVSNITSSDNSSTLFANIKIYIVCFNQCSPIGFNHRQWRWSR